MRSNGQILFLCILFHSLFSFASTESALNLSDVANAPSGLTVQISKRAAVYDGYLVFCPEYFNEQEKIYHGPRIYHPSGAVFWAGTTWRKRCIDARIQQYGNRSVLTFWYDNDGRAYGAILDEDYNEIQQIHTEGAADLHEFRITPDGQHVLMIAMRTLRVDLTSVGALSTGLVNNPFIQEFNITSGELVWEWSAAEHLPFTGSYRSNDHGLWEYAHCNAVLKDEHGDYLISFRYYSSVVKIDGATKAIIWTLGGKHSDFTFHNGSTFIGQHDPSWVVGTNQTEMTLFDNDHDDCWRPPTYGTARGIWVRLNYANMSVTLLREYLPLVREPVVIEGGVQILPNSNVLVAFGSSGSVIEYTRDGGVVFAAQTNEVYRAYKVPKALWQGVGLPDPSVDPDGSVLDIDTDVNMVFDDSPDPCHGLAALLGACRRRR